MDTSSRCSHWWIAILYFAMSITLAVIITTSFHSNPNSPSSSSSSSSQSIKHATQLLTSHGFNFTATLLHMSPELFSSSPQFTIFAIQDGSISNPLMIPSSALKQLLLYHITPTKYTFQEILNKPHNSCLQTLLKPKKIVITKTSPKQRSLEINNVLITHPDLFLQGPFSIHGVSRPFAKLDQDLSFIHVPICDSSLGQQKLLPKNKIDWPRIIHLLSSKGYVSFAIGLNSVLEGIIQDHIDLDSVTVLAPLDLPFVASSSPALQKIVKFHMLPGRFSFQELASLPVKASLRTLLDHTELRITTSFSFSQTLAINGVEIISPDVFSSNKFVIHGISESFPMGDVELPSVLR